MENRTLKLEVEELNNRIEHLKKTILRQYERAQEDDEVGDLGAAMQSAKKNAM